MEHFRRYFGHVSVLFIVEDGLSAKMFDIFSSSCPKIKKLRLSDAVLSKEPLKAHLLILELSKAAQKSIGVVLSKSSAIETVVFCDNFDDGEILRFAVSKKISWILNRNTDAKELAEVFKELLISISTKQKQKSKQENYAKLIENSDVLFCIKKAGKIVFASPGLMNLFGTQSLSELNEIENTDNELLKFLITVADEDEDSVLVDMQTGESYLVGIRRLHGEQLISCVKTKSKPDAQTGYMSHTDFIELLKNTLLQREANEDQTFAVTLKLENAAKIMSDFGSEFFYAYFKKFSSFCNFFFEKDPLIFWYFDYIVILPQISDEDAIKAAAEELFAQSGQFEYEKEIVPFIDVSVLSLTHLSVNGSISIIESIYAKTQTQTQNAKILLALSSTSTSVGNGQMAMYHIQNIADKSYPIKLLNIYKGLSIVSASKITKIDGGDIYVQTEKIQKYLMYTERSVIIQSEHTPKEIFVEVWHVDGVEPYAILRNPIFLEFSANNRKSVRVQCDVRIPITVSSNKFTFTGEIFDISIHAIAIRYKNKINGDIAGTEVKLSFSLPSKESENGVEKVVLFGQITVVKNAEEYMTVIVAVKMEPQNEEVVLEYIYTRQKELIAEIKKLGGMIFK